MDEPAGGGEARTEFETTSLPAQPDAVAPDGCDVRLLLALDTGSIAHFELAPDRISAAVRHRTVDEVWYVLGGRGEMWRSLGRQAGIVELGAGVCISIPVGTAFQFRSFGDEPLAAIGVTMPPWPGAGVATIVVGPWAPTVAPGPV
jgi:mannose-6-phosphate isomerase-like protein (cupin superfamily)